MEQHQVSLIILLSCGWFYAASVFAEEFGDPKRHSTYSEPDGKVCELCMPSVKWLTIGETAGKLCSRRVIGSTGILTYPVVPKKSADVFRIDTFDDCKRAGGNHLGYLDSTPDAARYCTYVLHQSHLHIPPIHLSHLQLRISDTIYSYVSSTNLCHDCICHSVRTSATRCP